MLEIRKSMRMTGTIMIDNQVVSTLYAEFSTEMDANSNSSINETTQNKELYIANREEVRKQIQEFTEAVWAEQDELISNKTPQA